LICSIIIHIYFFIIKINKNKYNMSVKPQIRNINTPEESNITVKDKKSDKSSDKDYYNMSIATFTFGGKQNNLPMHMSEEAAASIIKNGDYTYTGVPGSGTVGTNTEIYQFERNSLQHNSFLYVVIISFWNMKIIRNFLTNDLVLNLNDKDPKNKLLSDLKNVIMKYSQTRKIDLGSLRNSLADQFQNRRKFLINQPDDPVDCYFAFLNAIHSYSMVLISILKIFF